jgi:hypothetical protein
VINALELHVALGGFPEPQHHIAEDVMESERTPGDVLLVEKGRHWLDDPLSVAASGELGGRSACTPLGGNCRLLES